ncbi:hypothetical protein ACFL6X_05000 [Candidatus Latescibacterota bacterium]
MNQCRQVPIHTTGDTMELLDKEELAFTATVVAEVVLHLAQLREM